MRAGLTEVLDLLGVQPGPGPLCPREPPGRVGRDVEVDEKVLGRRIGLGRLVQRQPERVADHLPAAQPAPVTERHRDAGAPATAGAPAPGRVDFLAPGAWVV